VEREYERVQTYLEQFRNDVEREIYDVVELRVTDDFPNSDVKDGESSSKISTASITHCLLTLKV
jgi:hypothetical protein